MVQQIFTIILQHQRSIYSAAEIPGSTGAPAYGPLASHGSITAGSIAGVKGLVLSKFSPEIHLKWNPDQFCSLKSRKNMFYIPMINSKLKIDDFIWTLGILFGHF